MRQVVTVSGGDIIGLTIALILSAIARQLLGVGLSDLPRIGTVRSREMT